MKSLLTKKYVVIFVGIFIILGGAGVFIWQMNRTSPPDYASVEFSYYEEATTLIEETPPTYEEPPDTTPPPLEMPRIIATTMEEQAANLQKLAMVWGFTKYTHPVFLTGERCWDTELFELIPIVRFANPDDVNDFLYSWYIGLGDDGFDNVRSIARGNTQPLVCVEWRTDELFLGNLAAVFSRFNGTWVTGRSRAPVMFDQMGTAIFSNQGIYPLMDASSDRYRLLGLFRLWNAMKYYFPYINLIDDCWNELLFEHIIIMLEGDDTHSYQLTLASLASRLHDPHIRFSFTPWMFDRMFGPYVPPLRLTEAEGQLVVVGDGVGTEIGWLLPLTYESTVEPGDVVLSVNGVDINEIIAEMLQYVSYPNRDKALFYLATYHAILRQHSFNEKMQLDVLRNGSLITVEIETVTRNHSVDAFLSNLPPPGPAHAILENNIGLINPSNVQERGIAYIMANLADTDGLIVDLRQYPALFPIVHQLATYLVETHQPFSMATGPSQNIPGVFYENVLHSGGGRTMWNRHTDAFFYENNVVILMNERSFSRPEFAILSLRNGANVTVMGTNSMGSNGDVRNLPLPGGNSMSFSSLGIFAADGGQTQRIGIEPDIRVERTIAGIRNGKDELMEAAIEFLLGGM